MKTYADLRCSCALAILVVAALAVSSASAADPDAIAKADPSVSPMRSVIDRYAADRTSIGRHDTVEISPAFRERMRRFYEQQRGALESVNFDGLDPAGKVDYLLLRNDLAYRPKQLRHEQEEAEQVASLVPFAAAIIGLEEARRGAPNVDGAAAAKTLAEVARQVASSREALEQKLKAGEAGK